MQCYKILFQSKAHQGCSQPAAFRFSAAWKILEGRATSRHHQQDSTRQHGSARYQCPWGSARIPRNKATIEVQAAHATISGNKGLSEIEGSNLEDGFFRFDIVTVHRSES
jgi:hypothetical protein